MTISEIRTEFGNFYINQGQNAARLYQLMRAPAALKASSTLVVNEDTVWRASSFSHTSLLQGFQKAWTPKGDSTFRPELIECFRMKADIQETPDDLVDTWLGFLAGESTDRKTWPFVRWLVENLLIPQLIEEEELEAAYKGVRVVPTVGVAGTAAGSMNGLGTILQARITAGRITPIVMGAVPVAQVGPPVITQEQADLSFYQYVRDFTDRINYKYWVQPMEVMMNPQLYRRYIRGYHAAERLSNNYDGVRFTIPGTLVTVSAQPSMIGRNRLVATPKANLVCKEKGRAAVSNWQIENVDRTIKIYTDYWRGYGFILPEAVFVSDQV